MHANLSFPSLFETGDLILWIGCVRLSIFCRINSTLLNSFRLQHKNHILLKKARRDFGPFIRGRLSAAIMAKNITEWLKRPWLNPLNTLEALPWSGTCLVECQDGFTCMAIGNSVGVLRSPHFCLPRNASLYCPATMQTTTTACPPVECPTTTCPDIVALPPAVEQGSTAIVVLAVLLCLVSLYGLWTRYVGVFFACAHISIF